MPNSESKLTPSQNEILDFISASGPDSLYNSISTTLSLSMGNFTRHYLDETCRSGPTESTLEHWLNVIALLEGLHKMAVEEAKPD